MTPRLPKRVELCGIEPQTSGMRFPRTVYHQSHPIDLSALRSALSVPIAASIAP